MVRGCSGSGAFCARRNAGTFGNAHLDRVARQVVAAWRELMIPAAVETVGRVRIKGRKAEIEAIEAGLKSRSDVIDGDRSTQSGEQAAWRPGKLRSQSLGRSVLARRSNSARDVDGILPTNPAHLPKLISMPGGGSDST
jgi:hypothetical protein